ncbi:MAG: cysteine-rich CWC family protein [Gammaproteobacteria bacterium]|nr:cysteine-rich CWC family protein [Gammaproteobacteria bacterium]
MGSDTATASQICPACGQPLRCGVAMGDSQCWCFALPPQLSPEGAASCLCPDCLAKALAQTSDADDTQATT